MKQADKPATAKNVASQLSKFCAYRHLYEVVSTLIKGGKMSEQAKAGRNIALLGFFCPFFWIALLTGDEKSTIILHATHSLVVFFIGLVIMVLSRKQTK